MLINKAVSPVMLPALLGLANVMANRRAAAAEGLTSAAVAQDLEKGPSELAETRLSMGPPSPPVPPVPPVTPVPPVPPLPPVAAATAADASPDVPAGALLLKELERLERLEWARRRSPPQKPQ